MLGRERHAFERYRRRVRMHKGEAIRRRRGALGGHAVASPMRRRSRGRRCGHGQIDRAEVDRLRRRQLAGGRRGALERPDDVGLGDLYGEDVAAAMGILS